MAKRPVKKTPVTGVENLINALAFVAPATNKIGTPTQTHIRVADRQALAFNGIVAIGCPIDVDLDAYPHFETFEAALDKCEHPVQITQLGDNRLSIRSGPLRANVQCLDASTSLHSQITPNPPVAAVDKRVVDALVNVGVIAQENAPRIMLASVCLQSGSAIATDGHILFQAWHGWDLPTIIIPKSFIQALVKLGKEPKKFGFSETSATFWFDDHSWIRTQLYTEKWPDVISVLDKPANPWPIPAGLWDALDKIVDHSDTRVYFAPKSVRTEQTFELGASCEIEGNLPDGLIFDINYLLMIAKHAKTVDWLVDDGRMAVFHGDNWRGLLMHIKERNNETPS